MAYRDMKYREAIRVLVEHGDITMFSQITDSRLAGIAPLAEAAGMFPDRFRKIRKTGLQFTNEEIKGMADHIGIHPKKMKELIQNDPLYQRKNA